MSVAYPATLPQPIAASMALSPKKQNLNIETDSGAARTRISAEGDVYVLTATFVIHGQDRLQDFIDFVRVSTSYGNHWFTADWLTGIGFTAATWAFRFVDIKEAPKGNQTTYNCVLFCQEAADVDLENNDWPFSDPDPGFEALRFGLIAPNSDIASATSASIFNVPLGDVADKRWVVGWVIELYHRGSGDLVSGPRTISGITGDQITVGVAFGVTPTVAHGIRFASYDDVVLSQKLYAFITDGDLDFVSDGEPPYVIMYP